MKHIAMFLALVCAGVATLLGGCKTPPTQTEMKAVEYGPRPDD